MVYVPKDLIDFRNPAKNKRYGLRGRHKGDKAQETERARHAALGPEGRYDRTLRSPRDGAEARERARTLLTHARLSERTRELLFGFDYRLPRRLCAQFLPPIDSGWTAGRYLAQQDDVRNLKPPTSRTGNPLRLQHAARDRLQRLAPLFAEPLSPKYFSPDDPDPNFRAKPELHHQLFANKAQGRLFGIKEWNAYTFDDFFAPELNAVSLINLCNMICVTMLPQYMDTFFNTINCEELYTELYAINQGYKPATADQPGEESAQVKVLRIFADKRRLSFEKPFDLPYLVRLRHSSEVDAVYDLLVRCAIVLEWALGVIHSTSGHSTFRFQHEVGRRVRDYRMIAWPLFMDRLEGVTNLGVGHFRFLMALHPYAVNAPFFKRNPAVRAYANMTDLTYLCSVVESEQYITEKKPLVHLGSASGKASAGIIRDTVAVTKKRNGGAALCWYNQSSFYQTSEGLKDFWERFGQVYGGRGENRSSRNGEAVKHPTRLCTYYLQSPAKTLSPVMVSDIQPRTLPAVPAKDSRAGLLAALTDAQRADLDQLFERGPYYYHLYGTLGDFLLWLSEPQGVKPDPMTYSEFRDLGLDHQEFYASEYSRYCDEKGLR